MYDEVNENVCEDFDRKVCPKVRYFFGMFEIKKFNIHISTYSVLFNPTMNHNLKTTLKAIKIMKTTIMPQEQQITNLAQEQQACLPKNLEKVRYLLTTLE